MVGCFLETIAAITILVPVFLPIIEKLGIDPVQFGVIMVLNLMIGLLTPPVGMVLYVLSRVSGLPFERCVTATHAVPDPAAAGAGADHLHPRPDAVAADPGLPLTMPGPQSLTVCYNGACPVCRAEIEHYRRAAGDGSALRFLDVAADAAAAARHGLTGDTAYRRLHTIAPDGSVLAGIPAFVAVWERLPRYRWLARAMAWPLLRACAAWGYERLAAPALFRVAPAAAAPAGLTPPQAAADTGLVIRAASRRGMGGSGSSVSHGSPCSLRQCSQAARCSRAMVAGCSNKVRRSILFNAEAPR